MYPVQLHEPEHHDALQKTLSSLNSLFNQFETVKELLQNAAETIVRILDVEQCVVYWHVGGEMKVHARALNDGETSTQQLPELDFENGAVESPKTGHISKLLISNEIVGYLHVPEQCREGAPITREHALLLQAICEQIAAAVEMQKIRQLLASKYAVFAVAQKSGEADASTGEETLKTSVLKAVKDPDQVARMIAGSFYKDLRKAGFETKQILMVASEIIDGLSTTLKKTDKRTR